MEDIISVTSLWLSCLCECMFVHVFKYLHCPQNCGSPESNLSSLTTSCSDSPLPKGSHRSPSIIEEKNPDARPQGN